MPKKIVREIRGAEYNSLNSVISVLSFLFVFLSSLNSRSHTIKLESA